LFPHFPQVGAKLLKNLKSSSALSFKISMLSGLPFFKVSGNNSCGKAQKKQNRAKRNIFRRDPGGDHAENANSFKNFKNQK
jgi:hypothetical protein